MSNSKKYSNSVSFTQKILMDEYLRRKSKNKQYSLRAFARQLSLPAGRLSELLSGKRCATPSMILKLSEKLKLKDELIASWLSTAEDERRLAPKGHYSKIDEHEIELLRDWHHFVILSLIKTNDFKTDPKWIASRLRLSTDEVNESLLRLTKLGFLKFSEGNYKVMKGKMTTTHEIASMAIRNAHRQYLEQAEKSLDSVPVPLRDITSICMAIDLKKLPSAKKKIEKFRRDICSFLSTGDTTEVYRLNIQLLPTTFRD